MHIDLHFRDTPTLVLSYLGRLTLLVQICIYTVRELVRYDS